MKRILSLSLLAIALIATSLFGDSKKYEEMSLEELLNIEVVTASKHLQKMSEAPAIVRVITAEQIRQRGYESVGEALQATPGLYIIDDHLSYNLGVRGINGGMRAWSRIIKLMIDNQPVSYRSNTANFLGNELIPIRAVERIEIVLGPGSALYGANAYLGVVNIITKKADDLKGGLLSVDGGTENGNFCYGGDLVVGGRMKKIGFMLAGQVFNADRSGLLLPDSSPNIKDYKGERSKNDLSRPKSLFGSLTYRDGSVGKIALLGNLQYQDRYGEFQDWGVLTHQNRVSLQNWFVKGEYTKDFKDKLLTKLSLAYAEGNPTANDHLDIGSPLYWKKRETGYRAIDIAGEAKYHWNLKDDLTLGFDYSRDSQNLQTVYSVFKQDFGTRRRGDVVLDGRALGDTAFNNLGLYGQGIYHPTDRIGLTVGVRYDQHNIYGDVFNSRAGLVYEFPDERYWKILYGTSFKAPAPLQLFTKPLKSGGIVGNPDLQPERAKIIEGAVCFLNLKRLNCSANAFYNTIKKKVEFVYERGNLIAQNLTDLNSYGFEIELRWQLNQLGGYSNLSYQRTEKKGEDLNDKEIGLYPHLINHFGINYAIPQYHLNLNLQHSYIGKRRASQSNIAENAGESYQLEAYNLFNFTLSTDNLNLVGDKETVFSFKVENIADKRFAEPGYKGIDIPNLGRKFLFRITQGF